MSIGNQNYQVVLNRVHDRVHDGEFFSISHIFENVSNDASVDILIDLTNSTFSNHVIGHASCGGDAFVYVYENPTISSDGTSLNATNHNRYSSNTASGLYFHTPTISDIGTELYGAMIPGGTGGNSTGGSDGGPFRKDSEYILKAGNKYIIRLTNKSGGTKHASIGLGFYQG